MLLLLAGIFVTLVVDSLPAMKATGFTFFTGTTWDPVFKEYGSLVFLVGTLLTSFLALAISLPFSLAIAIFLGEYFREGIVSSFLKSAIELMAGIPECGASHTPLCAGPRFGSLLFFCSRFSAVNNRA